MDQTQAQLALTPYLALAKSATSPRAAADLINQATTAPGTYIFAELLAQPNISKITQDQQYASHHKLLEIFSWGTWETYKSISNLPPLNDAQTLKLRLLSLLSYAAEKNSNLSYQTLSSRLDLASSVDLEHLVTTAIYSGLLTATLNPAEQQVLITSVAPLRDLAPGSIKDMLADLEAWSGRCDSVLADLEAEISKIKASAAKKAARDAKLDKVLSKITADSANEKSSGNALGQVSGNGEGRARKNGAKKESIGDEAYEDENFDDAMDIDQPAGRGNAGAPNSKKPKAQNMFDKLRGR